MAAKGSRSRQIQEGGQRSPQSKGDKIMEGSRERHKNGSPARKRQHHLITPELGKARALAGRAQASQGRESIQDPPRTSYSEHDRLRAQLERTRKRRANGSSRSRTPDHRDNGGGRRERLGENHKGLIGEARSSSETVGGERLLGPSNLSGWPSQRSGPHEEKPPGADCGIKNVRGEIMVTVGRTSDKGRV